MPAPAGADETDACLTSLPVIPLPGDESVAALPEDLRRAAASGAMINVFRALLRSPAIAESVIRLGSAQFAAGSMAPVDRELVILACGELFEAPYGTAQHDPISRAVGVVDEQRAAIAERSWTADCFSTAQRSLLTFVTHVATASQAPVSRMTAVRAYYSDQQVVEVVVLVGYYFLIARVSTVLNVPIDAPADDRVLRAGQNVHGQRSI